jgi:hypothetical protein
MQRNNVTFSKDCGDVRKRCIDITDTFPSTNRKYIHPEGPANSGNCLTNGAVPNKPKRSAIELNQFTSPETEIWARGPVSSSDLRSMKSSLVCQFQ